MTYQFDGLLVALDGSLYLSFLACCDALVVPVVRISEYLLPLKGLPLLLY